MAVVGHSAVYLGHTPAEVNSRDATRIDRTVRLLEKYFDPLPVPSRLTIWIYDSGFCDLRPEGDWFRVVHTVDELPSAEMLPFFTLPEVSFHVFVPICYSVLTQAASVASDEWVEQPLVASTSGNWQHVHDPFEHARDLFQWASPREILLLARAFALAAVRLEGTDFSQPFSLAARATRSCARARLRGEGAYVFSPQGEL